jgi:hypothetical protein
LHRRCGGNERLKGGPIVELTLTKIDDARLLQQIAQEGAPGWPLEQRDEQLEFAPCQIRHLDGFQIIDFIGRLWGHDVVILAWLNNVDIVI